MGADVLEMADLFKKLNISGAFGILISAYPLRSWVQPVDYLYFCHG